MQQPTILLVEDELFVALELHGHLQSLGCAVLSPFNTVKGSTAAAHDKAIDGALLDVNVKGEMIYPLALELMRKSIPVVLCSGYTGVNFPEPLKNVPIVHKPFSPSQIRSAIRDFLLAPQPLTPAT